MFYQMATTQALAKHPTLYRTETKYTGKKKKITLPPTWPLRSLLSQARQRALWKGEMGFFGRRPLVSREYSWRRRSWSGQRRLPGRCRWPRGVRPLCICCESPGGFERDSVIPRLEGLGAVVLLVVILRGRGVGGGPEGAHTRSHSHLWSFTPSLPGSPWCPLLGEMLYPKAWFSVERWGDGGGPYLQTDLILIPVVELTCKWTWN